MITQMKELIGISVNRTAMGKTVKSYNGINNTKCLEYISCKKKKTKFPRHYVYRSSQLNWYNRSSINSVPR